MRAQVARRHEAVPAVVAGAGEHEDAQAQRRAVAALHGRGHAGPRALHQLGTRHEAALDRGPVQAAHLVRGEEEHVRRA